MAIDTGDIKNNIFTYKSYHGDGLFYRISYNPYVVLRAIPPNKQLIYNKLLFDNDVSKNIVPFFYKI
jgi:hypothetical protein